MPRKQPLVHLMTGAYNNYLRFANAAKKADYDVRMRTIRLARCGPDTRDLRAAQLEEARERLTRTTNQRDAAWVRHLAIADEWAAAKGLDTSEAD